MNSIIVRLNDSNKPQTSPEGVKINKIVGSIKPSQFIILLRYADNKVNPRIAKVNRITKSIHDTLDASPDLMWLKSKGLLIATLNCELLERNRVKLSFKSPEFEGIMDGGHNAFAVAIYIVEKLFDKKIKTWDECKTFWDENYETILDKFKENENQFQFSIPLEIITPNEEDGAEVAYYDYISEICSARNNNIQLSETAKGNQEGFYEVLKDRLKGRFDIIWKAGEKGKIKSEDVISLAALPLLFLKEKGILPEDSNIRDLNKISIYSQKSRCVDFFNSVMENEEVSEVVKGKKVLRNNYVESALGLTEDILKFFDLMYFEFPKLYNKAIPGKFGRVSSVLAATSRAPFYTINKISEIKYPYGFFYPLIAGLTSLMELDEKKQVVKWRLNPTMLDLGNLNLAQYVLIVKLANWDPQKVGKGEVFYKEAESVFEKLGS